MSGGRGARERHQTGDRKNPQPVSGCGVKHHGDVTGTLPLERLPRSNPGRWPGSRHTPTLCAFLRVHPSVVFTEFVPLTVAGQRWSCTSFPAHSTLLRGTLAFFDQSIGGAPYHHRLWPARAIVPPVPSALCTPPHDIPGHQMPQESRPGVSRCVARLSWSSV
jgi:hypothetical protein